MSDPTGASPGVLEGFGSLLAGLAAFWVAVKRTGKREDDGDAADKLRDAVDEIRQEQALQALEGNREIAAQQADRIRQLEDALRAHHIRVPPRKG